VSDDILDEVADVLARKFDWPQEDIGEARRQIKRFAQKVRPAVSLEVVKADPDDDRILECASAAGSDYIVSGDRHLLRLSRYDSMRILKLADFLELVEAEGRDAIENIGDEFASTSHCETNQSAERECLKLRSAVPDDDRLLSVSIAAKRNHGIDFRGVARRYGAGNGGYGDQQRRTCQ
jgi:predicted nucleic acid-binding protein